MCRPTVGAQGWCDACGRIGGKKGEPEQAENMMATKSQNAISFNIKHKERVARPTTSASQPDVYQSWLSRMHFSQRLHAEKMLIRRGLLRPPPPAVESESSDSLSGNDSEEPPQPSANQTPRVLVGDHVCMFDMDE